MKNNRKIVKVVAFAVAGMMVISLFAGCLLR